MVQRRRWLVSGLATLISLLLVSGAAVAVIRAGRGDGVRVRASAAPPKAQTRSGAPAEAQPQSEPQPPPPAPSEQQPQPVPGPPRSGAPSPQLGPAVIDVGVATLWLEPGEARPVDEPSLTNPVDVSRWVSTMTLADKLWLVGKLATQALGGEPVTVVDIRGDWAKVVVADQPSSLDRRGYPGWLPTVQLSRGPAAPGPGLTDVPAGSPTGAELVRSAEAFAGIPYLWAGVSPAGFDCSGLTWAVYRAHGIVIPRDAADQAGAGSPVDIGALAPGDLLFYASGSAQDSIHHVAMYVGNGMMVQSPATGRVVETVPIDTPELALELWGARRYLAS